MASNILEFLQAASNAAASNVSGPVDGLAWLLRKAGVPVGNAPVGGSEWMKQNGLTRDVQPGLLSVAGETAGLLSPAVVAAKAPQVAAGLLRMGENVAAPRLMSRQKGAVYVGKDKMYDHAYHGTESNFNRVNFDDAYYQRRNEDLGDAFWMTPDKAHAWAYAQPKGGNTGNVKEADVFLRNPKVVDAWAEAVDTAKQAGLPEPANWPEAARLLQYTSWAKSHVDDAMKAGHDALIIKRTGDAPIAHDHLGIESQLADHLAIFAPNRVRNIR